MSLKTRQKRSKKRIRNVRLEVGEIINFMIRDGNRSVRSRLAVKNATLTPIQDIDPFRVTFVLMPPRELHIEIDAIPIPINRGYVEFVAQ